MVRPAAGADAPPGHDGLPLLAILGGLLTGWLHFRMDYAGHTEVKNTRRNRVLASTPLVVVDHGRPEVGSMAKGFAQRYPDAKHHRQVQHRGAAGRARSGSCGMADDVLVEADTNAGMLQPVSGQDVRRHGPLGGENPVGFTPTGSATT